MRKILVVLVAAISVVALGCGEGSNPIGGSCVNGQTAECTAANGSAGVRTCVNGAYSDCAAGGACTPNMVQSCVTACTTVGTQTCNASGVWGNCTGGVEECDGKDNDCNGQTDEGLIRDCETDCGVGKKSCTNAEWSLCSAPSPQVEQCDGLDNDCNGQTDENLNAPAGTLSQAPNSPCTGQTQTCKGVKGWEDPNWATIANYEVVEATCDGIDNDCDGFVDAADSDVGADGCACTTGEADKVCGTDVGECSKGIQQCVPSPSGGNAWTECGGTAFNGPSDEACDGLDNNCDGQTDEGNPTGGELCGTANKSQGGVYEAPCTVGQVVCDGGQLICMGGVDPTPEVCDNVDNDCNGVVDDDISSDQYEQNNTCATAKDAGAAIENQSPLVITASLFDPGNSSGDDVDWYKITAKEGGGFCLPTGTEGPFTVTIKLKNIPEGSDYDLCVWNVEGQSPVTGSSSKIDSWEEGGEPNVCGSLPGEWPPEAGENHNEGFGMDGSCEEQGHFKTGSDPEEYSFTWTGKCLQNDDQTFYVKVLAWSVNPDIDCAPYNLEVSVTK